MTETTSTVATWMQRHFRAVSPDSTAAELLLPFADHRIAALAVVDDRGRFVGIVSYASLIQAEAASGADTEEASLEFVETTCARDLLTSRPLTISPAADLRAAARQMLSTSVQQLFVVADDQLIGTISSEDIVRAVAAGSA